MALESLKVAGILSELQDMKGCVLQSPSGSRTSEGDKSSHKSRTAGCGGAGPRKEC